MDTYIERLRNRPDHHKRRIALGVSTIVTSLIFVVWMTVLFPQGGNKVIVDNSVSESKRETPISTLKNGVAQVYEAMRGIISETNKSLDLEAEYERMKGQVENGDIQITPEQMDY